MTEWRVRKPEPLRVVMLQLYQRKVEAEILFKIGRMGERVLSDGVVERNVGNIGYCGIVGIDGGELQVLKADFGAFERPRIGLGFGKEDEWPEDNCRNRILDSGGLCPLQVHAGKR